MLLINRDNHDIIAATYQPADPNAPRFTPLTSADEFKAWPKIERLERRRDWGVITEKIDGTNGLIKIVHGTCGTTPTIMLHVGSRSKWLAPGKTSDNFGFAQWAFENRDALIDGLGEGEHYGEWYGLGIQNGYGLDHKRFALFNERAWRDEERIAKLPPRVDVVPLLYEGPDWVRAADVHQQNMSLPTARSKLVPTAAYPEGFVVYIPAEQRRFKCVVNPPGKKEQLPAGVKFNDKLGWS